MARTPRASIVVPVWNAWEHTRACLAALYPTLSPLDEVVVVDNGSTDATPSGLERFPWVRVVRNETNRGFGPACNQGAAASLGAMVVFLNNDTLPAGRWLDDLLEAFDDPTVGAAGPRSNAVSGPQIVPEAAGLPADPVAIGRFARTWRTQQAMQFEDIGRLVGFCLAVRRSAFEAVGGFDEAFAEHAVGGFEDDDLCRRLLAAGWRLVVAHRAFVWHRGHATFEANHLDWYEQQCRNEAVFLERARPSRDDTAPGDVAANAGRLRGGPAPLVSACLITRDEQERLPECLASLEGIADEIVVYDTGSTDATRHVAASFGATVVEGYWDDDFARARNAALEHCRGEFILWLDADERVACADPAALRRFLARLDPAIDAFQVTIENLQGFGVQSVFTHVAVRLFRRERCHWVGKLHEQVHRRDGTLPEGRHLEGFRIVHSGYLDATFRERGKAERNLRLAEAELAACPPGADRGVLVLNLGRALLAAGRPDEALEYCIEAARTTTTPTTRRFAWRVATHLLLAQGRLHEAEEALAALRRACERQVLPDLLEAELAVRRGEYARALELLDRHPRPERDDDGFEHLPLGCVHLRAQALAGLKRPGEAADVLLDALATHGVLDAPVGFVLECLAKAGRSPAELGRAIPARSASKVLAALLRPGIEPATTDEVMEAAFRRLEGTPGATGVLACATLLGRRLALERALVWSARLRRAGLEARCPLVARAADPTVEPAERLLAAAVAKRAFDDARAERAFEAVATAHRNELEPATIEALRLVAPDLADLLDPPLGDASPPGAYDHDERGAHDASTKARPDATPKRRDRSPAARLLIGHHPVITVFRRSESHGDQAGGPPPAWSVVVVLGNGAASNLEFLKRLAASLPESESFEVVVLDNATTDATRHVLASLGGDVVVARARVRLDPARAAEAAAALARGELVVVVDRDAPLEPGWLDSARQAASASTARPVAGSWTALATRGWVAFHRSDRSGLHAPAAATSAAEVACLPG